MYSTISSIDLVASRLQQLFTFGQSLSSRQQKLGVPVVRAPSVGIILKSSAGL